MIQLSKYPINTLKTSPKWSENRSTSLLLQWGFIRQEMAWVYNYLPLGYKILRKIEQIVREEMDKIWCLEIFMWALSPREVWEKTGRWDTIDVLFHLPATWDKEYGLNSTHEEIVTPLMKEFINSYKDLPVCVYQIQTKFRNEKRAKSGLLRGREFRMKDAYSFHKDDEDFTEFYEQMKQSYINAFSRLWIGKDTVIAMADWGTFTDKYSHEFQTFLEIWEDIIYIDPETSEAYNQEVAPAQVWIPNISDDEFLPRQDIKHGEDIIWVEALEKYLWIPKEKTTKTMFFESDDNRFIIACVRWDYDINEIKLRKILWCKSLFLANEDKVLEITWAKIWFAWIIDLPDWIEIYLDDSIKGLTNFETWTNKTGYHSININFWRDLELPDRFYDFKDAKKWDKNPNTWNIYEVRKASEVGNIFPLETKFSNAFGLKYLDENNKEQEIKMWCYGLGTSRVMWVIAEYCMDEVGIAWPESVAPADYYIIIIWEENIDKGKEISIKLEQKWKDVILDDRMNKKIWFGQKIADAELLGIPNIITISPKTLERWGYELRKRWEKEGKIITEV